MNRLDQDIINMTMIKIAGWQDKAMLTLGGGASGGLIGGGLGAGLGAISGAISGYNSVEDETKSKLLGALKGGIDKGLGWGLKGGGIGSVIGMLQAPYGWNASSNVLNRYMLNKSKPGGVKRLVDSAGSIDKTLARLNNSFGELAIDGKNALGETFMAGMTTPIFSLKRLLGSEAMAPITVEELKKYMKK